MQTAATVAAALSGHIVALELVCLQRPGVIGIDPLTGLQVDVGKT